MKKFRILMIGLALLAMSVAIVSCSGDDNSKTKSKSLSDQIVDTLGTVLAQGFAESVMVKPASAVDVEDTGEPGAMDMIAGISDIALTDSKLYAAFDGGLVIYDFLNRSPEIIWVDDKLEAVTVHEEDVYAGGNYLYKLVDDNLVKQADEFGGIITSLYSYNHRLMVGTTAGLYSTGIFGKELLFEDAEISAMTADNSGLWVGTDGSGLYRWDGETFKKRYLIRDPALFDTVLTVAFGHDHLYVGTVNGLHIFNGGSWETITEDNDLPSNRVNSVEASDWVVYIATDAGTVGFFNGDIIPVNKLDDKQVVDMAQRNGRLIAATADDGIFVKNGRVVNTLVDPIPQIGTDMLSINP